MKGMGSDSENNRSKQISEIHILSLTLIQNIRHPSHHRFSLRVWICAQTHTRRTLSVLNHNLLPPGKSTHSFCTCGFYYLHVIVCQDALAHCERTWPFAQTRRKFVFHGTRAGLRSAIMRINVFMCPAANACRCRTISVWEAATPHMRVHIVRLRTMKTVKWIFSIESSPCTRRRGERMRARASERAHISMST